MSTKSHVLNINGIEIYEETSEPQSISGVFKGFNLYIIVEPDFLKSFKISDGVISLEIISNEIPEKKFEIPLSDTIEIDYDIDGLLIVVKGGTSTERFFYAKYYGKIN